MDSTQVDVNNYRNNLQQFNLGEPGSPTYIGFENASNHPKNEAGFKTQNVIHAFNPLQIGLSPFDNNQSLTLYRAFAPFTKFNYLQGPGKTIAINALHTQNFGARNNITLDYKSVTSQEQYVGSLQNNTHRNIHINQLSISKNGKYKQVVYLGWEQGNRQENGGLASETDFSSPLILVNFKHVRLAIITPDYPLQNHSFQVTTINYTNNIRLIVDFILPKRCRGKKRLISLKTAKEILRFTAKTISEPL